MRDVTNEWTRISCLKHGLIQFKIVHRLHYSPEKLAKIYPGTNPVCPRCGHSPAKLGHMFWSCNSLNNFWVRVFEAISSICDRTVNPDPTVAIFGVFPSEEPFTVPQVNAVAFITLLARRQILLLWNSVTPPSFRHWIKEVLSVIPLEKLRYNRSNLRDRYIKTWAHFIEFVENVSFTWCNSLHINVLPTGSTDVCHDDICGITLQDIPILRIVKWYTGNVCNYVLCTYLYCLFVFVCFVLCFLVVFLFLSLGGWDRVGLWNIVSLSFFVLQIENL